MSRYTHMALLFATLLLWLLPTGQSLASCIGLGCNCSVTASNVAFDSYDPFSLVDNDSAGDVEVTCGAIVLGATISYEIELSSGAGSFAARRMSNGTHDLTYNLFTDAGRTTVWGNGGGGTSTVSDGYLLSLIFSRSENYPVYGRLYGGQNVSPGLYTDTITVTIIY